MPRVLDPSTAPHLQRNARIHTGGNDRLRRNPQHDTHRRPGCDPVCSEQARSICTSTIVSRVLDTKPLLLPIRRSDPARSLLTWLNFDRFHTPCLLERTLSSLWAVTHVGQVKHLILAPPKSSFVTLAVSSSRFLGT